MNPILTSVTDGDVVLTPSWILTTNHPQSSCGMPVLVHRPTGEAFGPGDIVGTPPDEGGFQPASAFVRRLGENLPEGGRGHVAAFLQGSLPS